MAEKVTKKKALLAASVAGILAFAGSLTTPLAHAADVQCWGINKCKGTGDCGGKNFSCAGQNSCKGQGWLTIQDEATCLKIEGGTLQSTEE